jgi:hypothetical protein
MPICRRRKIGHGPFAEADMTVAWIPGQRIPGVSRSASSGDAGGDGGGGGGGDDDLTEEVGAPADLPRVKPRGRALVASNWHWFTDEGGWNGGFVGSHDNDVLLLNLAAVASQRDVWR